MTQDRPDNPTDAALPVPAPSSDLEQRKKNVLPDLSFETTISAGAPVYDRRADRRDGAGFRPPIAGALCVIFAVTAFYRTTLLLAPFAIIAGIIALFRRQYGWAAIGIIAASVALLTDIAFWTLLGAAWIVRWLLWS
ncbi:MAG: hypothetical protein ABWY00_06745 [Dongiaceae bacterium]